MDHCEYFWRRYHKISVWFSPNNLSSDFPFLWFMLISARFLFCKWKLFLNNDLYIVNLFILFYNRNGLKQIGKCLMWVQYSLLCITCSRYLKLCINNFVDSSNLQVCSTLVKINDLLPALSVFSWKTLKL